MASARQSAGHQQVVAIFKVVNIPPLAEEVDISRRRYGKIILDDR
ncbi:MAG: hypothetical protein R3B90_04665 [Planctomycetaceae bacterium]